MKNNNSTEITAAEVVPPLTWEGTALERMEYANGVHEQVLMNAEDALMSAGKTWRCSVVLGGLLASIKQDCAHGEFGKLFNDAAKRLKSAKPGEEANGTRVYHFNFSSGSAKRYMALYKKFAEKANKNLPEEQAGFLALEKITDPRELVRVHEVLLELSDAHSIRQVLEEEGLAGNAKSKTDTMLENRSKDGGHENRKPAPDPDAALEEARALAEEVIQTMGAELETFFAQGRFSLVPRETLKGFQATLQTALNRTKDSLAGRLTETLDGEDLPAVNVLGDPNL